MSITPDTLRPETLAELEANLEQMKTANYFLRVAVDQVPEAVLIVEAESGSPHGPRVLFSNAAAAVLVGVEPEKGLRGMNLADLAAGDMDAAVLMQSLRESVTNGGSHECECRVQNLYGREPLMCRWRARAVFNSQRKLLNHTLMITPKPALSAAAARTAPLNGGNLDAQSELLKQANLALLARGIAHDVNNLLGIPFMALSEMLQDAALPPGSRDTLTQIYQSLDLARQFTSRVLSACKDQPGTVKPADIAAIIQSTVKVAGAGANVELRVRAAGDLHRPVIDGVRLAQVLQNLILNGIQAMPTGGYMDIEAANTEFAEGQDEQLKAGRYVRIIVRDRGCGIPPENLARLFREPFTTKPGGNGIGLTTCRHYIKSEQGDIRVSSRTGVGTEFTVYLPVRDTPPQTPPDDTAAAPPPC
ncbi:MAG TPA: ATP-binding protein [Prosthecobacter sp.]|nr:ATP-binding protein [Prosthecobacter sp.]